MCKVYPTSNKKYTHIFSDKVCAKSAKPLGLEAGIINDRRMMATSMKTLLYRPEFARLNNNSAWCVDPNALPTRHYLKV